MGTSPAAGRQRVSCRHEVDKLIRPHVGSNNLPGLARLAGRLIVPQADGAIREPLAQLVEHRTFNPRVGGSIPPRLTISIDEYGRRRNCTACFGDPIVQWLGHRPFTPATRVRVPLGSPTVTIRLSALGSPPLSGAPVPIRHTAPALSVCSSQSS